MTALIDTGFLYATLDKDDKNHVNKQALAIYGSLRQNGLQSSQRLLLPAQTQDIGG